MSNRVGTPDLEELALEDVGKMYAAARMEAWEEAYQSFNSFVTQFKSEFGKGRLNGDSIALYDEMMEKSQEALGVKGGYDKEVWDVQNAFIFGGNRDVELEEFRDAVTEVLEGGRTWEYYAEEGHP